MTNRRGVNRFGRSAQAAASEYNRFCQPGEIIKGISAMGRAYDAVVDAVHTTHYRHNPYQFAYDDPGDIGWDWNAARAAALTAAGFNTLRWFIKMDVFMDSMTSGALNTFDELYAWKKIEIDRALADGFKVVLQIGTWIDSINSDWNKDVVCDGVNGPNFTFLMEAQREFITRLERDYGARPDLVCPETFNENSISVSAYQPHLEALHANARTVAGNFTIMVQGTGYANIVEMTQTDTAFMDANTMIAFHDYGVGGFSPDSGGWTHQGGYNPYLPELTFPLEDYPGGMAQAITNMEALVDADGSLDSGQKVTKKSQVQGTIEYLWAPENGLLTYDSVESRWVSLGIDTWIAAQGLNPQQVIDGEMGCTGAFNFNGRPGCPLPSRALWHMANRDATRRRGLGGTIAHRWVGDFHIFGYDSGATPPMSNVLIPELVAAII